jgi:hypothetical protein
MHIGYWWESQNVGGTILKWILEGYNGVVWGWIGLAHDMDEWRALENTVVNFRVP